LRGSSNCLLALPTSHLLDRFGGGQGTPGSGSAAALLGSVASSILIGSGKLACLRAKPNESLRREECGLLVETLKRRHAPALKRFVDLDSELFDGVLEARRKRDAARAPRMKQHHGRIALRRLQGCTELLIDIAEECIEVAKIGWTLFNLGFRPARGEPATAVAAAVAGAQSAILVALINLSSFRGGAWAVSIKNKCMALWQSALEMLEKSVACVAGIREEAEIALGAPQQMDLLGLLGAKPRQFARRSTKVRARRRLRAA